LYFRLSYFCKNNKNKKYPSIEFVRIGSYERIHEQIKSHESSAATAHVSSVQELDAFYKSQQLVATTCSSIGHAVFDKLTFDYCVVDEASQVLLSTCLGPLFAAHKFILVGDLEQLPPIVKSKHARLHGMAVSLFEWLVATQKREEEKVDNCVELVQQYRMNSDIMALANRLTYANKLQCVCEKVASGRLHMSQAFLATLAATTSSSAQLSKVFTDSVVFIDTSEVMKAKAWSCEQEDEDEDERRTVNAIECEVVRALCQLFHMHSAMCESAESVGIIAPYNNQVRALQTRLAAAAQCSHKSRRFYEQIEVSTVDQFQGRDKSMIVMSFTNSKASTVDTVTKELEILNDKRRLTVAITRAKHKLIMVGCVQSLVRYKPLASLIAILKETDSIVTLPEADSFERFL
jgi:DNA replication ATP-dependent helicase Dna2